MTDEHVPALNRGVLPNGIHHFLIAWPNADLVGRATTPILEAGPFNRPSDAIDSRAFYDLMLRENVERPLVVATEYRLVSLEVGERLAPAPGTFFIVARTDYLEAPVAGGFSDYGTALWVYGLIIDHVAARLAYLGRRRRTVELSGCSNDSCRPDSAGPSARPRSARRSSGGTPVAMGPDRPGNPQDCREW